MGKFPNQDNPPPYAAVGPSPSSSSSSSQRPVASFTSHLESHLSNLPNLIRASQHAHQTVQTAADIAYISLLVPHIESLLHRVATTQPHPPNLAEMILVPAGPVSDGWRFTAEEPRQGVTRQLVRVSDGKGVTAAHDIPEGGGGRQQQMDQDDGGGEEYGNFDGTDSKKKNPSREREFDDWGRFGDDMDGGDTRRRPGDWWWNDESLANRLARHLQPRAAPSAEKSKKAKAPEPMVAPPPPKPQSRWGSLFRSPDPVPVLASRSHAPAETTMTTGGGDEQITMTVKVDEVTFRKENEFGVFESKSGFGIVVLVRTKLRR